MACAMLACAVAVPALADEAQAHYAAGLEAAAQLDHAGALERFRQAAALGHREAQRTSGMMLLYGSALYGPAIPGRKDEAMTWLSAAAGAGCEVSRYLLSRRRQA